MNSSGDKGARVERRVAADPVGGAASCALNSFFAPVHYGVGGSDVKMGGGRCRSERTVIGRAQGQRGSAVLNVRIGGNVPELLVDAV